MGLLASKRICLLATAASLVAGISSAHAEADLQSAAGGAPRTSDTTIADIVVTARRRAESAQDTPVSVTVVGSDQLFRQTIKELRDLTASVPGVNLSQSSSSYNSIFSIRGQSRGATGNAQPAVATYFNDVPLPLSGSSIPTFDIQSVQVLKGPQGTLFGRNTTAGAVLINSKQPTYSFEGYLLGTLGSYSWHTIEGALNVPIVDNRLAVRVAGQLARRDGYTKNLSFPGNDLDDIHRDNVRVSVLAEPFDGLKNVTVFEYDRIDEAGTGVVFNAYTPGGTIDLFPYYNGTLKTLAPPTPCNGDISCDIRTIAALRNSEGPRKVRVSNNPFLYGKITTVTNTTTLDLGPALLKNIFGYRKVFIDSGLDIDGTALPAFDSNNRINLKQITDEFQLSGEALDGKLKYIGGLFYSDTRPAGTQVSYLQILAISGTPFTAPPGGPPFGGPSGNGNYFYDRSKAAFGQISYDFGNLSDALAGLSIDAGIRYTRDIERVCVAPAQSAANPAIPPKDCPTAPLASQGHASFSKWTYTAGLNYKISPKILVYGVTRRGYRAGGLNTPTLGGTLVPFQSFAPEVVNDIELGLKSEWKIDAMHGRFNLAAYRSKSKGLQAGIPTSAAADPDGDGNALNNPASSLFFANVGNARIKGIETELTILPVSSLELSLGATWLDHKVTSLTLQLPATLPASAVSQQGVENAAFYGVPKYGYTADVRYTLPLAESLGAVSASVHYYQASATVYGSVQAPRAKKLDLRLDWRGILGSSIDAALFVTNLTNETYPVAGALSAAGLGINSAIYNEPRIFGAQLRYSFGK